MTQWIRVHPLVVRVTHWINALAVLVMVASGWQIYNASPIFGSAFPSALTLGGCLAGETLRALLLVVNIMSK